MDNKENIKKYQEELRSKGFMKSKSLGWILRDRAIELGKNGILAKDADYGLMLTDRGIDMYGIYNIQRYLSGEIKVMFYRKGYDGSKVASSEFVKDSFKGM